MAWAATIKRTKVKAPSLQPAKFRHLVGKVPDRLTVSFGPLSLFTACARCSRLYFIDPTILGPEALAVQMYLQGYVKETKPTFSIDLDPRLKDSSKTYFAGLMADGIAYLTMIENGYVWVDHLEKKVKKPKGPRPDFVFENEAGDWALMEAKGTRSPGPTRFDGTVRKAYFRQVEPYLDKPIDGKKPVRGFAVGAYLTNKTNSHVVIHCTAPPATVSDGPSSKGSSSAIVRTNNYWNALSLIYGPEVVQALEKGQGLDQFDFLEFHWQGRDWLTRRVQDSPYAALVASPASPLQLFALEKTRVEAVFADASQRAFSKVREILPFLSDRKGLSELENGGVILPDGFAAISKRDTIGEAVRVRWNDPQSTRGLEQLQYSEGDWVTEQLNQAESPAYKFIRIDELEIAATIDKLATVNLLF